MNLSSIFSFKTLNHDVRRVCAPLLLTVVCFLSVDRLVQHVDPMRLYGGWENPYVQLTVERVKHTASSRGHIDVLFMGSSIGTHIDIGRWQEATDDQVVCVNASMGGQHPQWANFIFQKALYPITKPTRLVYTLCPRDLNGVGFSRPGYAYNGLLFQSYQARRLLAATPAQKMATMLEGTSYLFRARGHIRRCIQQGPIPEEPVGRQFDNGVSPPTVRHNEDKGYTDAERKAMKNNPYASLQIPDDGELGELLKLARFCRDRGIEFVVVSQPVAPMVTGLYDDPLRDKKTFDGALDKIRRAGFRVVDMASALPVKNMEFGDNDHPNRWGGYRMTDYLYRELFRPWYPDKALAPSLPDSVQVNLCETFPKSEKHAYIQDRRPRAPAIAAPLLVASDEPGARIPLGIEIPPGKFIFDLYGLDERTTQTPGGPGHALAYEVQEQGAAPRTVPFDMSRDNVQGDTLTRVDMTFQTTATVTLVVKALAGNECVLDSVFIRPKTTRGNPDVVSLDRSMARDSVPSNWPLIRDGSMDHTSLRHPGYPAEWEPYTDYREPWGSVQLVSDSHDGGKAAELTYPGKKGWGCVMIQQMDPSTLQRVLGREVSVSVWARSSGSKIAASLSISADKRKDVQLDVYKGRGAWQKLTARCVIPQDAKQLTITLANCGKEPALFDDVSLELLPETSPRTEVAQR